MKKNLVLIEAFFYYLQQSHLVCDCKIDSANNYLIIQIIIV